MSKYGSVEIETYHVLHLDHPCGGMHLEISEEMARQYKVNPRAVVEKVLGCSWEEYQNWIDDDGLVRCAGITKAGKQCKNTIGISRELDEYLSLKQEGIYCHVHQDQAGGGGHE